MKSKPSTFLGEFLLIVIIVWCCMIPPARASHAVGAAISYTHLGGSMYRLNFTIYRPVTGIPAPATVLLQANSASCGINTTYTLLPLPGTGQEIILICPGDSLFEKWEYENDIAVQGQCSDWIFTHSDCCRNFSITTIQNPGNENLYVAAHLNNLNGDNNSPQFTNDPLLFACSNQDFHYNNGMFDTDGDSLVYNLICARTAANSCVNYNMGYSALQPFQSNPPVTFDYFTGDLFMHPTGIEVGPIVFQILDYRNGELKGSVMRDVMMYTLPCANQNPTATHMNGTSQQIAWVFPTDTICFDIFSDDTDALDTVTMTWNQLIPAATFSTTTAVHPTGAFCWIPSLADVRSQPYMFTAMVRDNFCPLNNAGVYSYYIYVTLDSSLVFLNANDFVKNSLFSISPNPSNGIFTIHSAQPFSRLKIYNSIGECVLNKEFENRVNFSEQPGGIYFLEAITNEGKTKMMKLVKE